MQDLKLQTGVYVRDGAQHYSPRSTMSGGGCNCTSRHGCQNLQKKERVKTRGKETNFKEIGPPRGCNMLNNTDGDARSWLWISQTKFFELVRNPDEGYATYSYTSIVLPVIQRLVGGQCTFFETGWDADEVSFAGLCASFTIFSSCFVCGILLITSATWLYCALLSTLTVEKPLTMSFSLARRSC